MISLKVQEHLVTPIETYLNPKMWYTTIINLYTYNMEVSMPEKSIGLIHIYCGNGKGKTTTGMGLCLRSAGYGFKTLIYQFMKDNTTSERHILKNIPNITILDGLQQEKFSFQMTPQEKKERITFYENQFHQIVKSCTEEQYQVLFLDEILYTIRAGLFDEELLYQFLKNKPPYLEVILTGQDPSQRLITLANYVSNICKVKHPYDDGLPARDGIER